MVNLSIALVLGVIAAAQPTTALRSIELLNTPYQARARAWRFVGGLATTLGVVGLGAAIAVRWFIQGSSVPTTAIDTTDVVLGSITLAGVVVALLWKRSSMQTDQMASDRAEAAYYLFGVRTMATSLSAIALYVATVNEIFAGGGPWVSIEILLIVVTALVLLPGLLPLMVETIAPASADPLLDRLRVLCRTNGPTIAVAAWAIAGTGLMVRGLVN
jgi:hypothetical protein